MQEHIINNNDKSRIHTLWFLYYFGSQFNISFELFQKDWDVALLEINIYRASIASRGKNIRLFQDRVFLTNLGISRNVQFLCWTHSTYTHAHTCSAHHLLDHVAWSQFPALLTFTLSDYLHEYVGLPPTKNALKRYTFVTFTTLCTNLDISVQSINQSINQSVSLLKANGQKLATYVAGKTAENVPIAQYNNFSKWTAHKFS